MTDNDTVQQVVRDARYYSDPDNPCYRCGSEKSDHPNRDCKRWVQHVPPPTLLPQMVDIIEEQQREIEALRFAYEVDVRTLHVAVTSFDDWVLEKDDGPTPTRVAVTW